MIELGQPASQTGGADDLVKESTEATFMADVVDASMQVPVIVDFWATWCGPCKTLGPMLEDAVRAAKGAVRMVKVDVDRNQQIAAQLRIQSIPTVYAFWQGQPVDGFQGAVPGSEIKAFVDRLVQLAGGGDGAGGGLEEALAAADEMLAQGAAVDAAQTYAAILGEDPSNAAALAGLARAHLALGEIDKADGLMTTAPQDIFAAPELEAVRAQIDLARQAEQAGPLDDLRARVAAAPDDLQARFDLATALHAAGAVDEAVDALLEVFRRDRAWNDGAAKAQLFKIFDALPAKDPIVLRGRRRLSSMIFV